MDTGVTGRPVALLRLAHAVPGITRTKAADRLGWSRGNISEIIEALGDAGLLAERPASSGGARGRPTRHLIAHPEGPLTLGAARIGGTWRVAATELGGAVLSMAVPATGPIPDLSVPAVDAVAGLDREAVDRSYRAGLAGSRRAGPPALRQAVCGAEAPMVGAAETAWSALLERLP